MACIMKFNNHEKYIWILYQNIESGCCEFFLLPFIFFIVAAIREYAFWKNYKM